MPRATSHVEWYNPHGDAGDTPLIVVEGSSQELEACVRRYTDRPSTFRCVDSCLVPTHRIENGALVALNPRDDHP